MGFRVWGRQPVNVSITWEYILEVIEGLYEGYILYVFVGVIQGLCRLRFSIRRQAAFEILVRRQARLVHVPNSSLGLGV